LGIVDGPESSAFDSWGEIAMKDSGELNDRQHALNAALAGVHKGFSHDRVLSVTWYVDDEGKVCFERVASDFKLGDFLLAVSQLAADLHEEQEKVMKAAEEKEPEPLPRAKYGPPVIYPSGFPRPSFDGGDVDSEDANSEAVDSELGDSEDADSEVAE
jgi:hypothetical protein